MNILFYGTKKYDEEFFDAICQSIQSFQFIIWRQICHQRQLH